MQITCSFCHRSLTYTGEPPKFCGYCGKSLEITRADSPTPSEAQTLAGPQTRRDDAAPEVVGGYRVLRRLGAGGMGTVYEAETLADHRRVALKLLADHFDTSSDSVERFRQEGRLASAVAHPRCVFVLAADEDAGRPYIVMELMPGITLNDLIEKRGPLPPGEAVAAILQVAEGLQEAHRLGVIHRDVKPSNCFLDHDGSVKIGDFGLSKSLSTSPHLTRTGSFLGTPLYASPEQICKQPLDAQTDVYSLAATLYFLLTGRAPFQSGDAMATMARIVSESPPPMRTLRPELSRALDQVVLRGLERDRARRYRSLAEFHEALLPFLPGQLTIGGVGIRIGAYFIDYACLALLSSAEAALIFWALQNPTQFRLMTYSLSVTHFLILLVFYGVLEGIWGATPGKWLLNLRVCDTSSTDPPGLARGFWRALVFLTLMSLSALPSLFIDPSGIVVFSFTYFAVSCGPLVLFSLGLGLLVSTMRERNGYRGLHEFASGTRVIRLPSRATRRHYPAEPLNVLADAGLPSRLGPYTVESAARAENATLLLGEDPALGRKVLIALRPATEPELEPARRALTRPTRLRWLAQGVVGGQRWDAFLAPVGCSLSKVVATAPLDWPDAHPLLLDLTIELDAACQDKTLPRELTTAQVWVQSNGVPLLLDWPLTPTADKALTEPEPEVRAVGLLRRVAVQLLDRSRRRSESAAKIRAPLPLYARTFLEQLLNHRAPAPPLQTLRVQLAAASKQPLAVSRLRRAGHLALHGLLLLVGLAQIAYLACVFVLVSPLIGEIEALESELRRDGLRERADAERLLWSTARDPVSRAVGEARWRADMALCDKLDRAARRARDQSNAQRSALSWTSRPMLAAADQGVQDSTRGLREQQRQEMKRDSMDSVRWRARYQATRSFQRRDITRVTTYILEGCLLFWFVLWIVWAFVFRGGVSFWATRIALVRADGRKALRVQCLWRALLLWVPVALLLILSLEIEQRYWASWTPATSSVWPLWLTWALWWGGWGLLLLYVVLAVIQPRRALHDRLAGTYLVPR